MDEIEEITRALDDNENRLPMSPFIIEGDVSNFIQTPL